MRKCDLPAVGRPGKTTKRAIDPDVQLAYNDYNISNNRAGANDAHKAGAMGVVRELMNNGAPVTVLGDQGHMSSPLTPIPRVLEIWDEWGQFGLVWLGYLAIAGVLVVAAGALAKAILASMLHVDSWAQFSIGGSWPRSIDDATAASVLGLSSLLLLIPASFGYLLIMLVREAALVILLSTGSR